MINSHHSHRLLFFGTSNFAVPTLKALLATSYQLLAIITQPDKPKGRKQEFSPSPVKEAALKLGLKILQYPTLSSSETIKEIKSFDAICVVVASYGKIIPQEILTAFPKGCVNLHPSLLPKYRGPSPIQTALLNGDKQTGASIMILDSEVDHGPILAQKKVKVTGSDNYQTLHDRLANISADLLVKALPGYLAGNATIVPQAHKVATFTKLLTRDDGKIDWRRSATEIYNQIRAFTPWPGTWSLLNGKRLKILAAQPVKSSRQKLNSGEILQKEQKILVGCGLGTVLRVKKLQIEGKPQLNVSEFLKGNSLKDIKLT